MSRLKRHQNPHHLAPSESLVRVERVKSNENSEQAFAALEHILSPLRVDFVNATCGRPRPLKVPAPCDPYKDQKTELRILGHRPTMLSEPQIISDWPSRPRVSPVEDNKKEDTERRRRAQHAAIDVKTIAKQATIGYPTLKHGKLKLYQSMEKRPIGSIALLESLYHKPQQAASGSPRLKAKNSLIVHARSSNILARKGGSTAGSRFFFSKNGIGGKSAGYGWGYTSSFPRIDGSSGYVRDRMKKGVYGGACVEVVEPIKGSNVGHLRPRRRH